MRTAIIEDILDAFEFERVKKTMEALDWRWAGSYSVPSIGEMRATARQLFADLMENPTWDGAATGGFVAERLDTDLYRLSFCVEEVRSDEI